MSRRRRISAAAAVLAGIALAGLGLRPVDQREHGTGQRLAHRRAWSRLRRPGTKTVPSVTWAVYRDVNSLDPIYAFDYPENTAISLMCESLLRQAPDGSHRARPGHRREPVADQDGVHAQARRDVLGRPPGHGCRRRVQPGPADEPGARRLLRPGLQPGQVDRRPPGRPGDDHAEAARLLAARASWPRWPAIVIEKSFAAEAGQELRHARPAASCAPATTSSSRGRPASA